MDPGHGRFGSFEHDVFRLLNVYSRALDAVEDGREHPDAVIVPAYEQAAGRRLPGETTMLGARPTSSYCARSDGLGGDRFLLDGRAPMWCVPTPQPKDLGMHGAGAACGLR
jgi:hypothetical protein